MICSTTGTRRRRGALAVLLLVAVVTSCRSSETGSSDGGGAEGPEAHLEHVHGLAVDAGDGALYAGSHHGLFRVTDEGIEGPIGGRVQDFMGFTVAGPGRFLASGHPGPGMDGPGSVGLIESTDAGRTWTTRSLAGEADFHALEYRHDTVYGLDSHTGSLMVSRDLETWQTRSTLPMADFAVSPADADTLVATTEAGPALSTDGGQTFWPVAGAPLVLLVSWADDGTLVAAAPDGTVYVGRDPSTLRRTGELGGQPEALYAEDASTLHAVVAGVVFTSTDAGATFERTTG